MSLRVKRSNPNPCDCFAQKTITAILTDMIFKPIPIN
mgnify:CR=1 FL=1